MEENFRSRASQIALANAVIAPAAGRSPKRLKLTRGFDGETVLHSGQDEMEIGRAAVYLAGEESSYVTGHNLVVDGGMTMGLTMEQITERIGKLNAVAQGERLS